MAVYDNLPVFKDTYSPTIYQAVCHVRRQNGVYFQTIGSMDKLSEKE